ncbi:MAG TPA: YdcF family protein [Bacteroidia bacterium]|jgi:uncharacterized SAM-binding protein YcdF (DUF218 family)
MKRSLSAPTFLGCAFLLLCSYDKANKESIDLNEEAANPYDVIIVPGVPYQEPSMKTILKMRILWAKYLYERGITKNIIFSGSSVYTPFVEGKIMKIYADSLGIPSEHTFSEEEAEHSTENIYYSVQLAREHGFKRIAVATDQYQALLIGSYIRKFFPEVKILTIDYNKINLKASWPIIDDSSAYADNFVSLVKRESRFKRFKGTMGKNIIYNEKDSSVYNRRVPVLAKY